MVKHAASLLRQRLLDIHCQMESLLPTLVSREPLLKAYLSSVPRTCGNPGCHCQREGKRHAAWVVTLPGEGGGQTRSVGRDRYERLQPMAQAYRRFRSAQRGWKRLAREAQAVMKELEASRQVDARKELEKR